MKKVNKISPDCTLQLLNARGIGGYEHALHATAHALEAFARDKNIANDLGLEICVRASAQRQISRALDILGIKEGEMDICAVSVNCSEDIMDKLGSILDIRDDEILIPDENVLKDIYNLSDIEIEAAGSITNIMMEKTTLLILES